MHVIDTKYNAIDGLSTCSFLEAEVARYTDIFAVLDQVLKEGKPNVLISFAENN